MYKILRMICAVIAAVLVTVCIFLAIYLSDTLVPALGCAAGAALFFVLCLLFKYLQEEKENSEKADSAPVIPFDVGTDAASRPRTAEKDAAAEDKAAANAPDATEKEGALPPAEAQEGPADGKNAAHGKENR